MLISFNIYLWALVVGLPRGDEIRLITLLPLDEEHELPTGIRGSDDPLRLQPPLEAPGPVILLLPLIPGAAPRAAAATAWRDTCPRNVA